MEIFARLIVARQRAGLAHPGLDPAVTARQIYAIWDGLSAMRLNDREFDIATALIDGVRRLTGENYMQMVAKLTDLRAGLCFGQQVGPRCRFGADHQPDPGQVVDPGEGAVWITSAERSAPPGSPPGRRRRRSG
jgi:hypothetical protein